MIDVSVKTDVRKISRSLGGLRDDLRNKASVMAVNKTAAKGRSEMVSSIRTEFNLKASEIRPQLRVIRASRKGSDLTAILDPFASGGRRGRALNMIHFLEQKVTMAEMKRRRKDGSHKDLRFKVKRSGKPKTIKGAFIGNKGRTIFQRTSDARLPIKAVSTIDVPQMFNTRRINQRVVERIRREFPVEFERAARLVLKRFNR